MHGLSSLDHKARLAAHASRAPPQVLSRKLYLPAVKAGSTCPPKIVAVDLQPMAPIEGITQIQGDITSEATALQAGHDPLLGRVPLQ